MYSMSARMDKSALQGEDGRLSEWIVHKGSRRTIVEMCIYWGVEYFKEYCHNLFKKQFEGVRV